MLNRLPIPLLLTVMYALPANQVVRSRRLCRQWYAALGQYHRLRPGQGRQSKLMLVKLARGAWGTEDDCVRQAMLLTKYPYPYHRQKLAEALLARSTVTPHYELARALWAVPHVLRAPQAVSQCSDNWVELFITSPLIKDFPSEVLGPIMVAIDDHPGDIVLPDSAMTLYTLISALKNCGESDRAYQLWFAVGPSRLRGMSFASIY